MRLRNTSTPLVLVASAFTVATFAACSGIDGLPETPVDPSASDAASDAAIVDASDSGAVVDAGGNDASVIDGGAVDSGTVDATVDAGESTLDATPADATTDASVDARPCVAEDDVAFCTRQGKNCGTLASADNCGTTRTVYTCGSCSSYYETCGGGGIANRCGCAPESDFAFCWRLGRTCGTAVGTDNCGAPRTVGVCGAACPPDAGVVDAGVSDAGLDAGLDAGTPDASTVQRWTFTNCTATGATGPTQAQCDTAYSATNLSGAVTLNAGIQTWTVPANGTYRITAMGAQGGGVTNYFPPAGLGATIQGDFDLAAGDQVRVVVGQAGQSGECAGSQYQQLESGCGGGGGGTFVVRGASALVVAGGGGGTCAGASADYRCPCQVDGVGFSRSPQPGCQRYVDRNYSCTFGGVASAASCGASAGCSDTPSGTIGSNAYAGGGGGFAETSMCTSVANPRPWSGQSWESGARGGGTVACRAGGFGGGGGGGGSAGYNGTTSPTCFNGGGGGGGYAGGSGGYELRSGEGSYRGPGSGGSSYSSGGNPVNFSGYRAGDGLVVIERIR